MININCYGKLSLEDNFLTSFRHVLQLNKRLLMMVLSVGCVCGYESLDAAEYDSYIKLDGIDKHNSNSWRSKGKWSNGSAPSPENNYYVPEGSLLWFQKDANDNSKRIWQGGKLAIAGTLHIYANRSYEDSVYIPDLTICPGGVVRWSLYGPFSMADDNKGVVHIDGTAENPSVLTHHDPNVNESSRTYTLNALFKGTASNVLVYERPEFNWEGAQCHAGCKGYIPNDAFKDFSGTLRLMGDTLFLYPVRHTAFGWSDTHLSVENGAKLNFYHDSSSIRDATTNAYLRALSAENASLGWRYSTNSDEKVVFPLVNVGESVNFGAGAKVVIAATRKALLHDIAEQNAAGNVDSYSLIRLPSSAVIDEAALSSVVVAVTNANENFLPVKLAVANKVEGYKDIVLSSPEIVIMTNDVSQSSKGGAFDEGHESDWTNGQVPSPGTARHYWLDETPRVIHDISLPESVLSLDANFYCTGGVSFKFKEINLCGGSMVFWSGSDERTVKADKIYVHENSEIASSTPYVIVDAEFCGDATLTLRNNDDGYGKIRLDKENTNYSGRVIVTQQGPNADKNNITPYKGNLYLRNALSLGGKYYEDDSYRAITFSKYPVIRVQKTTAFNESTRGILIQQGVRLSTESTCTLTLSNQVTYAGIVDKIGSGTLDLAGTARFIDGNADTLPVAETNVLNVSDGKLRISSKLAADGLDIRFEQGTKLLIPAQTEAGYYNVKWDAPLTINTNNGKLPVVVEGLEADAARKNITVPICTFNAAAAANISEDVFDVSTDTDDLRLKSLQKISNEDGSVSYIATFGQYGSRIILR